MRTDLLVTIPPERDDRHLSGPTANVDDHVSGRLMDWQPDTDGGGHWLLENEHRLARPGRFRHFLHGPLLDPGDPGWDADDHPGPDQAPRARHPADEVGQHLLAEVEIGDHSVAQRPDGLDVAGCAADHALGLHTHGQQPIVPGIDGNHRRLIEYDATTAHIHQGVGCPEIHGHIPAKGAGETVARHELGLH